MRRLAPAREVGNQPVALDSNPRPLVQLARACGLGGLAGLATFALESALVFRSGAIGVGLETEGPFAALVSAVRPELPALLARVAAAYASGGAIVGLSAGLFAWSLGIRSRWGARIAFALELTILAGVLSWQRAVERPALFDDVPALRGVLVRAVNAGEPWHPRLALATLLAAHLGLAWSRFGGRTLLPLAALAGIGVAAILSRSSPPGEGAIFAGAGGGAARGTDFVPGSRDGSVTPRGPASPGERATARGAAPRLVLIVGIDAFRPDRLMAYGGSGKVAPNLEVFLEDATRFDRAYTPIAQTEPAWRSLLTARWPIATGVRYPLTAASRWEPLPTFPAALAARGWRTTFATDCSRFNFQDERSGFAERFQPPHGAMNFALEKLRYRGLGVLADNSVGARLLPEFIDNRALAGVYDPIGYARRIAAAIAERAEVGPALFAFHSTAAHFPGDPVYPHYRRFVGREEKLERRLRMFFAPIGSGTAPQDGWGRPQSEALYDELLSQADAQLGIVLEELRARGLYEDALVIVFSDHGESFHADLPKLAGATPVHGARLSDEESRVLLAIKPPGGRRVESVPDLVRLVDLGPTVLELAGAPPLPEADGVSLLPLLRGERREPLKLYAETGFTHASPDSFDPAHAAKAPRTFDAYRVRPDGVVELSEEAHQAVLAEKDVGSFDGQGWLIREPQKDGSVLERCVGTCAPSLRAWLDDIARPKKPVRSGPAQAEGGERG